MSVPFPRGFPTDWPVRPANFLQLDYRAGTRNLIHIWMPEAVSRGNQLLFFLLNEEADYRFHRPREGIWKHIFEKTNVVRMEGTCLDIEDGLALELSLTNLSNHAYADVGANVCVQLAAAPDFADVNLERTYCVKDSKLERVTPQPVQAESPTWGYAARWAQENFIAVLSRDGGHTIAQWWEGPPHCGGNRHPSFACLHAPPAIRSASAANRRALANPAAEPPMNSQPGA